MDARGTSKPRRPWWRLHVTTLIALAAVGSALGYCESTPRFGGAWATNLISQHNSSLYGWPLVCLCSTESTDWTNAASPRVVDVYWRSDRRAALFDFLAAIAMLVSTTTALEIWRRRELRWWQFSLRSFFVLTAVATVVATLYVNGLRINWWRSELYPQGQTIYQCGLLVTSFEP